MSGKYKSQGLQSENSKTSAMEIEIYNSNNRPKSKNPIFQLKEERQIEELKQKKNNILNSRAKQKPGYSNSLIENIDVITAVDKIKILKDAYEASRDKAAEVMKSEELSVYLQVHGQRTNKLYSALSTLIYASIGISKADELEDYIKKASSHVPTNLFNFKEWENVISIAKEFRVVDPETVKKEVEIMKNNTKLFHFLAKNPLKNTKEEILLLKSDVTNQLNAMQTDLINGKNLINFLAQKLHEIVNMSGVEKVMTENKELKIYYAKEYDKMQNFIDALVAKQKEETSRSQTIHNNEVLRLNEIVSKYESDLVEFDFTKIKLSNAADKARDLQVQLFNLDETLKNEKKLYKDTINNISISNFSDSVSKHSIDVALRNALVSTLQNSINTKNDEINDKILKLTTLESKYDFDINELQNKMKEETQTFEKNINEHVTSAKLLTETKEQLELTFKEANQKIKEQEDAIGNLQENLNKLKESAKKQADDDADSMKQLESKISDLENIKIPEMITQLEDQKKQLEERQLSIDTLEKEKNDTKELNDSLQMNINILADKENFSMKKNNEYSSVIEDYKNKMSNLEVQLKEKDDLITSLQTTLEENQNKTSQSDATVKDKEELIANLRVTIDENKIKMEQQEKEVKKQLETITDLQSQITQLEGKVEEINLFQSSSLANSVDLPPDVAQVQVKLDDTLKRMKDSETKYNKDVKYWKSQAETVHNQVKDLSTKLKESEERNKALSVAVPVVVASGVSDEEVFRLKEKIKNLESQQSEIDNLKDQNQTLQNKLSDTESKLKDFENKPKELHTIPNPDNEKLIIELSSINEALKKSVESKDSKLKETSLQETTFKKDKDELLLLVDRLNKEIAILKKSNELLEAQVSEGDNQSNTIQTHENSTFSFCESVTKSPRIAGASPRTATQYQAQAMVLDIIKKGMNSVKKKTPVNATSTNSPSRIKKTASSLDRIKAATMIASIIRGFLGRLRVKRIIAVRQGVLIAHTTTKQGETGWYYSQGLMFYFCMDKGDFVLLCGPITQDMYDLAMDELEGVVEKEKGKFPLQIILDRGAIHATRIQIEVLLEDIRERDMAIEQYKLDLNDYKNEVDQAVLLQYNKYQSQVDELAAKLLEYENSIVSLDKEREILTRKLQLKQKASDTNYDLILSEANALDAKNKKLFIKLTSLARGFIARLRVKKLILFKKSKESGVLIAMKNTKQGESGWYISPDSSIYYFVLKNGEWIHAIGPISEKEFERNRLMVKQQQRQNNPSVITKVPYKIIDYHDEVFEIGDICISNKYEKLFVTLPLDVLIPSGASRTVSVMDQHDEENSLSQLSSVSGLENIADISGSANNTGIEKSEKNAQPDNIKVTLQKQ